MTVQEFHRLLPPDDGSIQELVRGEVVKGPPAGLLCGIVVRNLNRLLTDFLAGKSCGLAVQCGLVMSYHPPTVRVPDVAFWSESKFAEIQSVDAFPNVAPDLIVDVRSRASDEGGNIRPRVNDYLSFGVKVIWVFSPENQWAHLFRLGQNSIVYREEWLVSEDVLPGFVCRVSELFE